MKRVNLRKKRDYLVFEYIVKYSPKTQVFGLYLVGQYFRPTKMRELTKIHFFNIFFGCLLYKKPTFQKTQKNSPVFRASPK